MSESIVELGQTLQARMDGRDLASMTSGQRTFLFGALAKDISTPAASFGQTASDYEAKATQLDVELRAMIRELSDIGPGSARDLLLGFRTRLKWNSLASMRV